MLDKTFAWLQMAEVHEGNADEPWVPLWRGAMEEVKALRTLPKIICLCGSARFRDDILAVSQTFTLQGDIVLAPNVFPREIDDEGKPDENVLVDENVKGLLDALHFRKIDLADQVHVVNVGGYIGQSVHNEVKYAIRHDKMVSFASEKVIPWNTRSKEPVSIARYMAATRQRINIEDAAL